MKVLITGGAGYIGNELVYRLAAADNVNEIVIYDNLAKGNYNLFTGLRKLPIANVRFIRGDILDSRKLRTVMEGVNVVYHLAANVTTPFADQNAHVFEQTNHWGTAEVVYAAEDVGLDKAIYLSSASVYGSYNTVGSVNDPVNPRSFYAISKQRGEDHMLRLLEKLSVYVIRCANVYGYSKNLRFDAVINRFMFDAHFSNRITVHGNGKQYRAFISMDRTVDLLHQLVDTTLEPGVYNLVDKNLSIIQIVETLRKIYPDLEMIFIDQHLPMHDIWVEHDERLDTVMKLPEKNLLDDLHDFKRTFTF
ncbi:MAG: dTDP-glucose 4,6-dehydratase [Gammaproteobacteria bacterium]|nr:dTDP-glucose 4,6-dehydratase [Gammaproteobacteria bacterium]